jgi:hypothetical protein
MFADVWSSLGEGYMYFLMYIALGFWAIGRLLKNHDSGGEVKNAAKGMILPGLGKVSK